MKASRVAQTIKPKVEPKGKIMWICVKCNNYNSDAIESCLRCGILQGYTEAPTSLTDNDILPEPNLFAKLPKPVGMTRRFSVGTMLILMTFYAVMFSSLEVFGANLTIFVGVTVFVTGIILAQMFSPPGATSREASFISGAIMGGISGIVALILEAMTSHKNDNFNVSGAFFAILFIFGGPFGYLAGGLIAGIFLFREREEQAAESEENETK
jgi:hypothetical protein